MRNRQWRFDQNLKRDGARAEALQGECLENGASLIPSTRATSLPADMVDRWSVIHVFILVGVGVVQVLALKGFFGDRRGPHGISARA